MISYVIYLKTLTYKSVYTWFRLFQRVITVKNQRWDGREILKQIFGDSVIVSQVGKKSVSLQVILNGSLNFVTNNFVIA